MRDRPEPVVQKQRHCRYYPRGLEPERVIAAESATRIEGRAVQVPSTDHEPARTDRSFLGRERPSRITSVDRGG